VHSVLRCLCRVPCSRHVRAATSMQSGYTDLDTIIAQESRVPVTFRVTATGTAAEAHTLDRAFEENA
jgi:hypothetical protein